jgi:hypothetical protein
MSKRAIGGFVMFALYALGLAVGTVGIPVCTVIITLPVAWLCIFVGRSK